MMGTLERVLGSPLWAQMSCKDNTEKGSKEERRRIKEDFLEEVVLRGGTWGRAGYEQGGTSQPPDLWPLSHQMKGGRGLTGSTTPTLQRACMRSMAPASQQAVLPAQALSGPQSLCL